MALNVVIMAAGRGTRMKSRQPKALHRLAGRHLLQHVLDMTTQLGAARIIAVTGHCAEAVEAAVRAPQLVFVRQTEQLGTGHAVQKALPALLDGGTTLILNGDVPLIRPATARALIELCGARQLALSTAVLPDPNGYGRIVRSDAAGRDAEQGGRVRAIVEHKDASSAERTVREIYTGMMAVPTAHLKRWLPRLVNHNAQGEYYLTDIVAMAVADQVPVLAAHPDDPAEVLGVNSASELAALERRYQLGQAEALMEAGVRLADAARFDLRGTLQCASDVEIDVGCVFEGNVRIGEGARIGAHCVIRNATIDAGALIHPFTFMDGESKGVRIGPAATVGPFARLRPGADLGPDVHVGNFVEVKNSTLAKGAKANHLAYVGDASLGERVNVGAGSITANYDGANKHRTLIGDDVHVGSNCVLVAPVEVGAGATIGAGSVVSRHAPAGKLTVARAKQVSIEGWKRPAKKK